MPKKSSSEKEYTHYANYVDMDAERAADARNQLIDAVRTYVNAQEKRQHVRINQSGLADDLASENEALEKMVTQAKEKVDDALQACMHADRMLQSVMTGLSNARHFRDKETAASKTRKDRSREIAALADAEGELDDNIG